MLRFRRGARDGFFDVLLAPVGIAIRTRYRGSVPRGIFSERENVIYRMWKRYNSSSTNLAECRMSSPIYKRTDQCTHDGIFLLVHRRRASCVAERALRRHWTCANAFLTRAVRPARWFCCFSFRRRGGAVKHQQRRIKRK